MVAILLGNFFIFFIQACTSVLGTEFSTPYDGDILKQLLESLIVTSQRPHQVKYIELRVPRAMIDTFWSNWRTKTTLPDLGIYSSPRQNCSGQSALIVRRQMGTINCKTISHTPYRNGFLALEPATSAAFVYIRLSGNLYWVPVED
jgi:hypothetical protein